MSSKPLSSESTHTIDGVDPEPPGSWPNQSQSQSDIISTTELDPPRTRGTRRPHRGRYQPRNPNYRLSRGELREFAALTLKKLEDGSYTPPHTEDPYDLAAKIYYTNENTGYYAPDDLDLENWATADLGLAVDPDSENKTKVLIREYSTLIGARRLHALVGLLPETENKTIGVLNFASAKKPGGGFINGAQAQEESIARASTLYPSLITPVGMQFYSHYVEEPDNAYYTHAMIYSPSVVLFRNDIGHWMKPIEVDVLTSAAVNAGEVREQVRQEEEMRLLRERVKEAEEKRKRQRERRKQLEAEWKKAEEEESKQTEETTKGNGKGGIEPEEVVDNTSAVAAEDKELEKGNAPEAVTPQTETAEDSGKEGMEPKEVVDNITAATTEEKELEPGNAPEATTTQTESTIEITTSNVLEADQPLLETPTNTQGTKSTSPSVGEGDAESQEISIQPTTPELEGEGDPASDPFYVTEVQIDVQMYERIGRLLYLFHKRGTKHLVLGSFGTGVFQNRVELVAGIFYDLLAKPDARFKNAFDTVVFAILGGWTVRVFKEVFGDAALDRIEGEDDVDEEGSEVEGMRDREDELDGEVQGKAEAGDKPMEMQTDGKAEDKAEDKHVEVQAEGTGTAEDNISEEQIQKIPEIAQPTDESNDVEMTDLTQEPTVEPKPDNVEPTANQSEQDQLTVGEPQAQSQT